MANKWKDLCICCRREVGCFDKKIRFNTGFVCGYCMRAAGVGEFQFPEKYLHREVEDFFKSRIAVVTKYRETKRVCGGFSVDDRNNMFKVNEDVFFFNNLLGFELIENKKTVLKGGLGGAIVGGSIFGSAGAVVGSNLGRNLKTTSDLEVRISLSGAHRDFVCLRVFDRGKAYAVISELEIISKLIEKENESVQKQPVSAADEIKKFKLLADEGIITQEEFEKKKAQLLGI